MGVYERLNDTQLDVMREIGNIGAGNACTALSVLMGTPIDMSVPKVQLLGIDSTSEYLGGGDTEVFGIRINVKEDLTGMMYHIINKRFAERIITTFYPKEINTFDDINEMDLSVISEMGNITSGAYANALATLSGYKVDIGTPQPHGRTVKEILSDPITAYGAEGDKILVVDEQFIINEEKLTSNMILVLDGESLEKLFNKLGVKM